jgi:hypothetical protein
VLSSLISTTYFSEFYHLYFSINKIYNPRRQSIKWLGTYKFVYFFEPKKVPKWLCKGITNRLPYSSWNQWALFTLWASEWSEITRTDRYCLKLQSPLRVIAGSVKLISKISLLGHPQISTSHLRIMYFFLTRKNGISVAAVQNERQPRNTATIRPETLVDMDHERALREAAVAVGVFG